MTPFLWALLFTVSLCDSMSIGVNKQNVTKREANIYPDWVPFKTKNGEVLGEFVDVPKTKPKKKRLAHPRNFILKAVAEPQNDDYFDKSQGESDNEDDFDKKEWSDVNRLAKIVNPTKVLNQTGLADISDIEGIVNIITKPTDDPVLKALKARSKQNKENNRVKVQPLNDEANTDDSISKENKAEESKSNKDEDKADSKKQQENNDYEEVSTENKNVDSNTKNNNENQEDEAKKKKILESVDELKERHENEQRTISEKIKEEEIIQEELERDRIVPQEVGDKYAQDGTRWKHKITPEYEEYEDQEPFLKDKYKIKPLKTSTTTTTTTLAPKTTEKKKKNNKKTVASGKLSVFRNPLLYIVKDEDETTTQAVTEPIKALDFKPLKFSSRYTEVPNSEDANVRISLVPADGDSKEGEPTLFFPKVKKGKRKFKIKQTSTPVPDSSADSSEERSNLGAASRKTTLDVADTTLNTSPSVTDPDATASNTAPSASETNSVTADTAPSATDSDSAQASTHNKEEPKHEDFHRETGNNREHHDEHDEIHEEHGKKAYEGIHKDTKSNKGHHDREDHLDKYHDHGGIDKHHHDHDLHYGSHHHEEHGKKHAKYEESGKHSKGHSTKGSHDIHKKEEYEKKVEFFEEDGDSDEEEFEGGHHSTHEHSGGGHFKKGQHQSSHGGHSKGEKGNFAKGGHGHHHKGHTASEGHDSHHQEGKGHHEDGGKRGGSRWVYHHGSPAKNAHLVVIDRRGDKYMHGPMYYG